jgi:uncharacterized Zn finger protein
MQDATMCPRCGSKRTTEITPGTGKPAAVWCHQCGSVSERQRDEWPLAVDEDDPIYAIWVPSRA